MRDANGQARRAYHVFDNRFVDRASGRLLRLDGGRLEELEIVPKWVLQKWPGGQARDIERAIWAAELKSRYLLSGYGAPDDAAEAGTRARGMFAALREEHGAAELHTVRRVQDEDQKAAFNQMHRGDFRAALGIFEERGAIHWQQGEEIGRAHV